MTLKVVNNSDPGTADTVGGNDWDNLANAINLGEAYQYYITKSGSTYYAKLTAGEIWESDTSAVDLIQDVVDSILASSRGGIIHLDAIEIALDAPIILTTSTSPKPLGFVGTYANHRDHGTQFAATTSFPTNRFMIETSGATDLSLKHSCLYIKDLGMQNNANLATKNIGGIKFETDYAAKRRQIIVDGFYGQYLHKGIAIQGPCWWSYFNNMNFEGFNASFSGDYDIKLEQTGTYTHTEPTVNGWPKSNHFNNIICVRNPGTMVNSLWVDAGNYNTFTNYMVDGTIYSDAIFRFGTTTSSECSSNTMWLPWSLDATEQVGQVGCLVLDGPTTYNNHFYDARLSRLQYMVTIKNGSFRNYIQMAGYWGAHAKVQNTGCGEYNVIEMLHGAFAAASSPNAVVLDGAGSDDAKVRVIDNRKGAYRRGTSTQSGNASTTTFNIAHGCFTTPVTWTIIPQTTDALGPFYVTAGSTNLVVNYPSAPPTGTNNLTWLWTADIYGDS